MHALRSFFTRSPLNALLREGLQCSIIVVRCPESVMAKSSFAPKCRKAKNPICDTITSLFYKIFCAKVCDANFIFLRIWLIFIYKIVANSFFTAPVGVIL